MQCLRLTYELPWLSNKFKIKTFKVVLCKSFMAFLNEITWLPMKTLTKCRFPKQILVFNFWQKFFMQIARFIM